jgi:hypothetical protein
LQDETKAGFDRVDTEGPLPLLRADYEGCDERTEVWREDDEGGPDVDFAGVLVEEEHVFDEHETAL